MFYQYISRREACTIARRVIRNINASSPAAHVLRDQLYSYNTYDFALSIIHRTHQMLSEGEGEGIRIFSWTAQGVPVEEVAPPPTRGARWKPGDSDDDEEEWMSRALDVAVDAEKIIAQAPMLQEEFQRLQRLKRTEAPVKVSGMGERKKKKLGKKERLKKARALLTAGSPSATAAAASTMAQRSG